MERRGDPPQSRRRPGRRTGPSRRPRESSAARPDRAPRAAKARRARGAARPPRARRRRAASRRAPPRTPARRAARARGRRGARRGRAGRAPTGRPGGGRLPRLGPVERRRGAVGGLRRIDGPAAQRHEGDPDAQHQRDEQVVAARQLADEDERARAARGRSRRRTCPCRRARRRRARMPGSPTSASAACPKAPPKSAADDERRGEVAGAAPVPMVSAEATIFATREAASRSAAGSPAARARGRR